MTGVKNNYTHNTGTNTGKDPYEFIGEIVDGLKSKNNFKNTT